MISIPRLIIALVGFICITSAVMAISFRASFREYLLVTALILIIGAAAIGLSSWVLEWVTI